MLFKKSFFNLFLKDIIDYLNIIEDKEQAWKIDVLKSATTHTSFNVEKLYYCENKEYTIHFKSKKTQEAFKVILFIDNNNQVDFYFDHKMDKIQVFIRKNQQKISLENYKLLLKDEYDLSSIPNFESEFLILFKKYILQDNLKQF